MAKKLTVTSDSATTGDSVTIKCGVQRPLWHRALTAVSGWMRQPRRRVDPVADVTLSYSTAGTYTIGIEDDT